jgi:lipopolysaccharide/colanic/teichoic acid biosynthesis glycosyltransferase
VDSQVAAKIRELLARVPSGSYFRAVSSTAITHLRHSVSAITAYSSSAVKALDPHRTHRLDNHYFYMQKGKRAFDVAAASLGLLVLSPLLILAALAVRLTSRGPALFRQARIGWRGQVFPILKFRTMADSSERLSAGVTLCADPRITCIGAILRRYKIDELPQLWNVLKGEMSLVGPRPELPRYVSGYSESQMHVLTVKPGITDPASVAYCHEDELLAEKPDPERYYLEEILPDKLHKSLGYLDRISFTQDAKLILRTIKALLIGTSSHARVSATTVN